MALCRCLPMSAAAVAAAAWASSARCRLARPLLEAAQEGLWAALLQVPPWAHWIPSADGVVLMLISANVAVFMLWRLADPRFTRKQFMILLDNFKSGRLRLHTLLTSAFSHAEADHLFTNMFSLYFFGTSIANTFGPAFLLKLYIAGALGGSSFFLPEKAFLAPRKQDVQLPPILQ